MSRFLHYEPCPSCRSNGRDSRGDNLGRYSDGSAYCFSCHYREPGAGGHHLVPHDEPKPKQGFPSDFTQQVPAEPLKWLLQYGLPYTYWAEHIGWTDYHQRLLFKVGTPPEFMLGRYFGEDVKRKWYAYGNCHANAYCIGEKGPSVLVEDVISMHKVGQVATGIALFGTKIHPCHIRLLRYLGQPVIIWLDKDQEHVVKSMAFSLQSILNLPVSVVTTEKDPKSCSFKEIAEQVRVGETV